MRLICPNCAAQYEVPDEVIPEEGRDVQCPACGDTWFQLHPSHPNYTPPYDTEAPEDDFDEESAVLEAADDTADDETALEPQDDMPEEATVDESADEITDASEEPAAVTQPRQELADDVASVLKEEAERETRAREAEMSGGLETQPDLGIGEGDDMDRRTQQAKARMARLRGFDQADEEPVSDLVQSAEDEPQAEAGDPEIDLGTRANLLPEVEDVDQEIEAQSEGAAEAAAARDGSRVATQKEGRGGFARGIQFSILLFVLAAAVYVFAPQLSEMVPALQEPLVGYTQLIDQGRTALQELLGQ